MDKREELGVPCLSAGEETGFAVILGAERLCRRLSLSGALLRLHENYHTGLRGRARVLSTVGPEAAVCACAPGLTSPFLPAVLHTLRHLSTTTSVLTDPSQLPEQAAEAVTGIGKRSGES